jgi:hypothetical protein
MSATPHIVGAPPHLSGEMRFRRDGDRLFVDHATPVMWFTQHVLEHSRADPHVGLSFDGTHVTLQAANGRWMWKLTGGSWCGGSAPGAEPLVMLEVIWPD